MSAEVMLGSKGSALDLSSLGMLAIALAVVSAGCQWLDAGSGWVATPSTPDARLRATAEAECLRPRRYSPGPPHPRWFRRALADLEGPPLLHDQRGPSTAMFLWADGQYVASCLVRSGPVGDEFSTFFVSNGPLPYGVKVMPWPMGSSGDGAEFVGKVDPAAVSVHITTDAGRVIEATTGEGWFIASWPGAEVAVGFTAFAEDGSVIA